MMMTMMVIIIIIIIQLLLFDYMTRESIIIANIQFQT